MKKFVIISTLTLSLFTSLYANIEKTTNSLSYENVTIERAAPTASERVGRLALLKDQDENKATNAASNIPSEPEAELTKLTYEKNKLETTAKTPKVNRSQMPAVKPSPKAGLLSKCSKPSTLNCKTLKFCTDHGYSACDFSLGQHYNQGLCSYSECSQIKAKVIGSGSD